MAALAICIVHVFLWHNDQNGHMTSVNSGDFPSAALNETHWTLQTDTWTPTTLLSCDMCPSSGVLIAAYQLHITPHHFARLDQSLGVQ
ncbi:hypothetical protein B7P43_G12008 [Cryptotermes secundus]|uniref:Uncharacterized protein n=1 Tax=Cryptotermes secundus TaxID=105785 RepID=A0A2J7R9Z4_9NEOP|nr:hypothetical protein B7P43_G12008 [Cryptotermes secundus]